MWIPQLSLGVALLLPGQALAQHARATPEDMVRCFAIEYIVGEESASCDTLVPGAVAVLANPDKYAGYVDAVMDGLEELAVTHPEKRVRVAAAVHLMTPGNRHLGSENRTGVVERVRHLYQRSEEAAIRSALIRWMPYQAEESQAIAFLEATAKSNRSPAHEMWPDQLLAVDALARMGESGSAALRRLHQGDEVQNALALQRLDHLGASGYRLETGDPPR